MALSDTELLAAARRTYERSRVAFALKVAAPVALIPAVSCVLGTSLASAAVLGVALVLAVALSTWRGGGFALGGISGLKAGVIPLAFAHGAKLFGHVCTPAGCTTLCVPACATGGLVAGALVEWWARRSERPNLTRGLGIGVSLLTGALGCSCVGYAGVIALLCGLALSMGAGFVVRPRHA